MPEAIQQPAPKTEPPKPQPTVTELMHSFEIAIDGYDDIFSDFDSAPYSHRLLSEDFLVELDRHYAQIKLGELDICFIIPKAVRNPKTETIIRKRIKDHFLERAAKVDKKMHENRLWGIGRVISAVVLSTLIFFITDIQHLPVISLVPALFWYLAWSGFELLFDTSNRLERKKRFYEKFSRAQYRFVDQESLISSLSSAPTLPQQQLLTQQ